MKHTDFYTELFYDLFISYGIKINTEYQFIYDEFLDHLIIDTNIKPSSRLTLERIFKSNFYTHISSTDWYTKIKYPETSLELKKRLRNNKLQKLNEI